MEKHWFVFYTKSRQEKKIKTFLSNAGYEAFLPLQSVMRQWSDRKKKMEIPLFNSYIFVNTFEHSISNILTVPGIAWVVRFNGKPAILRREELRLIERFISTGFVMESTGDGLDEMKVGDEAEIIGGPLTGVRGVITNEKNKFNFHVLLHSIDRVISIQIPACWLKKC